VKVYVLLKFLKYEVKLGIEHSLITFGPAIVTQKKKLASIVTSNSVFF